MRKVIIIIIAALFFISCTKEKIVLEFPKKNALTPRAPDKNPKVAF